MRARDLLVLLTLPSPGVARRSGLIVSHHDAQQQDNTFTEAFEESAEAWETYLPRLVGSALIPRWGPRAGVSQAGQGQGRFRGLGTWRSCGSRCGGILMHNAGSFKENLSSPKELLSLPVPELISELASLEKDLDLDSSDSAKILDRVCTYASNTFDPEANTVTLQREYLSAYEALRNRNVLRGFGSCADSLPELEENFTEADQERATGFPTTAFAPPPSVELPDLVLASASAFTLIYGKKDFGVDSRTLARTILAAIAADNVLLCGSLGDTIARTVHPSDRETVLQHEAGHLLVVYLLGSPIQTCLLNTWAALDDDRLYDAKAGTVSFDPAFGEVVESGVPTRRCLDAYSIVMMAGIAAEVLTKGYADSGKSDETALKELLSSLDGGFILNTERIRSKARWAASQAFLLLRDHESSYRALCKALRRGASLGEAIMAIEGALT